MECRWRFDIAETFWAMNQMVSTGIVVDLFGESLGSFAGVLDLTTLRRVT